MQTGREGGAKTLGFACTSSRPNVTYPLDFLEAHDRFGVVVPWCKRRLLVKTQYLSTMASSVVCVCVCVCVVPLVCLAGLPRRRGGAQFLLATRLSASRAPVQRFVGPRTHFAEPLPFHQSWHLCLRRLATPCAEANVVSSMVRFVTTQTAATKTRARNSCTDPVLAGRAAPASACGFQRAWQARPTLAQTLLHPPPICQGGGAFPG